jgi:hypothetical protein
MGKRRHSLLETQAHREEAMKRGTIAIWNGPSKNGAAPFQSPAVRKQNHAVFWILQADIAMLASLEQAA